MLRFHLHWQRCFVDQERHDYDMASVLAGTGCPRET